MAHRDARSRDRVSGHSEGVRGTIDGCLHGRALLVRIGMGACRMASMHGALTRFIGDVWFM